MVWIKDDWTREMGSQTTLVEQFDHQVGGLINRLPLSLEEDSSHMENSNKTPINRSGE